MIGEIGALGGGILPNLLGQSRQHTGSYAAGFICYGILALLILGLMRVVSRQWTGTWIAAGGRALAPDLSSESSSPLTIPINQTHEATLEV
jgi:NNP family nitrate/nitrite transporter-like MFS transporter